MSFTKLLEGFNVKPIRIGAITMGYLDISPGIHDAGEVQDRLREYFDEDPRIQKEPYDFVAGTPDGMMLFPMVYGHNYHKIIRNYQKFF